MKIHIVQKGDTLWKLAKKYGVDFEQIKSANTQLSNPDMIMPGMKIKIPTGSVPVKKETPITGKSLIKEQQMYQKEGLLPPPTTTVSQTPPPQPPIPKPETPKMPQPMQPMPPPEMPKMPQQIMQPMPQQKQPFDVNQHLYESNMNINFYQPQAKPMPQQLPTIPKPPVQKKAEPKKEMAKSKEISKPIKKDDKPTSLPKMESMHPQMQVKGAMPQYQSQMQANQEPMPQYQPHMQANQGAMPQYQPLMQANQGAMPQYQPLMQANQGAMPQYQPKMQSNQAPMPQYQPQMQPNQGPMAQYQPLMQPQPNQQFEQQSMYQQALQPAYYPLDQSCLQPISPLMPGCANGCGPVFPQAYVPMPMHQFQPMYQPQMMPMPTQSLQGYGNENSPYGLSQPTTFNPNGQMMQAYPHEEYEQMPGYRELDDYED